MKSYEDGFKEGFESGFQRGLMEGRKEKRILSNPYMDEAEAARLMGEARREQEQRLIEMSNQSCWTAAHASGLSVTPAEIAASINNMTSIDDWVAQGDDDTVSACYSGVSYLDVTDLQKFTLLMALIRNGKTQDEIDALSIIFADGEVCAGTIGSPCLGLKII